MELSASPRPVALTSSIFLSHVRGPFFLCSGAMVPCCFATHLLCCVVLPSLVWPLGSRPPPPPLPAPRAPLFCLCHHGCVQVDGGQDASMAIEPMVGGVLIGVTTMMCFLSLMTAIYWGEMSG